MGRERERERERAGGGGGYEFDMTPLFLHIPPHMHYDLNYVA